MEEVAAGIEGWKINLYLTAGLNLLFSFAMFAGIIASLQLMQRIQAPGSSGEG